MQYIGGKSRISKDISSILNKYTINRPFVSLFCGSCAIESLVISPKRICNDLNKYIIAMWKALQDPNYSLSLSLSLSERITPEQYEYIKNYKDDDPVMTAFVGFGCSYMGKFFSQYMRNKDDSINYLNRVKRMVLITSEKLKDVEFMSKDYREVEIPKDSVVYLDPPYNGTTNSWGTPKFDSNEFWNYVREISKNNIVFISEYNVPDDFKCIWQKESRVSIDHNNNNKRRLERLFMYDGGRTY